MNCQSQKTQMVAFGQQVGRWNDSPPRNSLAIIERAIVEGFDAIELDVRISGDGIAVLAHDDLLKGSEGEIVVSETSALDLGHFPLGEVNGVQQYISTLSKALFHVSGKDVLIDPRMKPGEYRAVRLAVQNAGFDPARLLFCVYSPREARTLVELFPESTLLYKIGAFHDEVKAQSLDDAVGLGMHGVMLFWPLFNEDFSAVMAELKARELKVLFYVHGAWPKREIPDEQGKSLQNMIDCNVDYVTTTACYLPEFKKAVGLDCV